MAERFGLGPGAQMVEIASNDGYLLQYALARGISVLGVEPAANVAAAATAKGIPTEVAFFGADDRPRDAGARCRAGPDRRQQCHGARART